MEEPPMLNQQSIGAFFVNTCFRKDSIMNLSTLIQKSEEFLFMSLVTVLREI